MFSSLLLCRYFGFNCSIAVCPLTCSPGSSCITADHGFCVCNTTATGAQCGGTQVPDTWYARNVPLMPSNGTRSGLFGHTTVYAASQDSAYTFGGYDLQTFYNAIVVLDFATGTTTSVVCSCVLPWAAHI